jgi:inhibitor of the pro-sigma K processing machinery
VNTASMAAYLFGGVMLYLVIWYFYRPLKWLMRLAVKSALGCVGLVLFNLLSGFTGITLGVNLVTSFAVGMLGLPGLGLLILLKNMI